MKIGIIDYDAGNLGSIQSVFAEIGFEFKIGNEPSDFNNSDILILPGVGSFKHGMMSLAKKGLVQTILDHAEAKKPILGICLGMHLLATQGDEGGQSRGLDLIQGNVIKLRKSNLVRVPHMGWNEISTSTGSSFMYFAHSYYFEISDYLNSNIVSEFSLGEYSYPAHIQKGKIAGIQYHPEKSGEAGLKILKRTLEGLYETK
jgi:glutamine amidotransferase